MNGDLPVQHSPLHHLLSPPVSCCESWSRLYPEINIWFMSGCSPGSEFALNSFCSDIEEIAFSWTSIQLCQKPIMLYGKRKQWIEGRWCIKQSTVWAKLHAYVFTGTFNLWSSYWTIPLMFVFITIMVYRNRIFKDLLYDKVIVLIIRMINVKYFYYSCYYCDFKGFKEDLFYYSPLKIFHISQFTFLFAGIFKSTCYIDVRWFPFDLQRCDLKFGSWTYGGWSLDLQMIDADITGYIANGEWDLVGRVMCIIHYNVHY